MLMKVKVPKVYVEGKQGCLQDVFTQLGWEIDEAPNQGTDIIVLMGGADIHPSWYGAAKHRLTNRVDRAFDHSTATLTEFAIEKKKSLIGICRGAQFINAISGGSMYQHVDGHQSGHKLIDLQTGQTYYVNSIHHQMMIPHESAKLVAVADGPIAHQCHYMEGSEEKIMWNHRGEVTEVEALYCSDINALCFQAHPEYADPNSPTRQYFYELLKRFYPQYFLSEVA
jgi:gamma-glutamyl-gamma-aminobutyrate hydrolase PuuD